MVGRALVAILGCGPAGLLCAWAVEQAGHQPVIYSRKQKSVIPGSQYLHERIPGLTRVYPDNHVQYVRLGTADGYALKVYGDARRNTGWENYLQVYPSWNVVKAYDKLWDIFKDRIVDAEITPLMVSGLIHDYGIELVISTLPQPSICDHPDMHRFDGVPYYIKTLPTPEQDADKDLVIYNGLLTDPWYRWSILSGICSVEYTHPPEEYDESDPAWKHGYKAVTNTCNCWPTVKRAGRWAEWKHGILLHDAYHTTTALMEAL